MKKITKLSIITICYNIKDEIRRTCESIVIQSWQNFEWIVVDGGSTDGTLDILNEYKNRINVLISEPDNGIYNAINKGIKKASGEWLNFMNGGDCFVSNDVLEQVFKNKNYESEVLYGRQYFAKQNKYRIPPEKLSLEWLCSNTLGHQASFYKRQLFYKFGFYDESFKIIADHEKNICFKKNNVIFEYLPINIAWFAETGISSNEQNMDIFIDEFNKIYEKYYSHKDIMKYGRDYCKPYIHKKIITKYKLFNFIPLIKTKEDIIYKNIHHMPKQLSNELIENIHFKTYSDLVYDIRNSVHKIKENIDLIIGIPRSGMIPAYILGQHFNCNVCSVDEFENNLFGKKGITREIKSGKIKNILIIDDSIASGKSMLLIKKRLEKYKNKYNLLYTAVYAQNQSINKVDYYFKNLSGNRMFEWNYLNHFNITRSCFDIDGVLCQDPTEEENDDGKNYIHFIKNAQPLYIPKYKIKALVTSRLEKYRKETENWLKKHNVLYEKLYMLDLPSAEQRRQMKCHATFKSEIYKKLTDCYFFYESDEKQAEEIFNRTGKIVLSVSTSKIFQKK